MDGDLDRRLVATRCHQRGEIGVVGFLDVNRHRLEGTAGTAAVRGVAARKRREGLLAQPVYDVVEIMSVEARAPQFDGHEVQLSCREGIPDGL